MESRHSKFAKWELAEKHRQLIGILVDTIQSDIVLPASQAAGHRYIQRVNFRAKRINSRQRLVRFSRGGPGILQLMPTTEGAGNRTKLDMSQEEHGGEAPEWLGKILLLGTPLSQRNQLKA